MVYPFERAAMRNDPPPDDLSMGDHNTYTRLAKLYAEHHEGNINRAAATWVKEIIAALAHAEEINTWHAELMSRIEKAAREYAHNATIENGDKFYSAVYNLADDWRGKRAENNKKE